MLGGVLFWYTVDKGLNMRRFSVFRLKVIQRLIILLAFFNDARRGRYGAPKD